MSSPEASPKPKRFRPSKSHLLTRRDRIAYKEARGKTAETIMKELKAEHKGEYDYLTVSIVYDDIEFIKKHDVEYISARFLPERSHHFAVATRNLEMIIAECWRRYEQGTTEQHEITGPDGITTKTIHREGGAEWMRLAGMASIALMKSGEHGIVAREATRVMADYRRLADLEKKGLLQNAVVVQPRS